MNLTRRGFLIGAGATAAATALVVAEHELWVPGKRFFSLPDRRISRAAAFMAEWQEYADHIRPVGVAISTAIETEWNGVKEMGFGQIELRLAAYITAKEIAFMREAMRRSLARNPYPIMPTLSSLCPWWEYPTHTVDLHTGRHEIMEPPYFDGTLLCLGVPDDRLIAADGRLLT